MTLGALENQINSPTQEDAAEIINSSGEWNDADASEVKSSYIEFNGTINSLSNFIYLGQYNGHSYFKNPSQLNWGSGQTSSRKRWRLFIISSYN